MVRVRLLANHAPLFAGEFAGYEEAYAAALVERGIAAYAVQPAAEIVTAADLDALTAQAAAAEGDAPASPDVMSRDELVAFLRSRDVPFKGNASTVSLRAMAAEVLAGPPVTEPAAAEGDAPAESTTEQDPAA